MTTKQLLERVSVRWAGTGTYQVYITYCGREYTCRSNNSLAWDCLRYDDTSYYTHRQALHAFWDECKRVNNLTNKKIK